MTLDQITSSTFSYLTTVKQKVRQSKPRVKIDLDVYKPSKQRKAVRLWV